MSQKKITNPLTGRLINVDGQVYQKLLKEGVIKEKKRKNVKKVSNERKEPIKKFKPSNLLPHQLKVVNFMKQPNHYGILVFHNTGSGKTITALSTVFTLLKQKKTDVIIIGPKSVLPNWEKELTEKFTSVIPENFFLFHMIFNKKKLSEIYDLCRKSIIILDEAHNLKTNIRSKDGKLSGGKKSFMNLKCLNAGWKIICLTATPIVNHLSDIFNISSLFLTDLKKKDLEENFPEIVSKLPISYYNHRPVGYPKATFVDQIVDMNDDEKQQFFLQGEIYNKKNFLVFLNYMRAEGDNFMKGYFSPKVDFIKNQLMKNRKKAIIFSSFLVKGLTTIEKIIEEINPVSIGHVTGKISPKQRQQNIEEFNSDDKFRILLISKAGSEGINLKGCRSVFMLEPGWNYTEQEQVIARAVRYKSHDHLPFSERNVCIYSLYLKDTIDMLLKQKYINPKKKLMEYTNDLFKKNSI